ncbi:MAG: hypothetical protein E7614_08540 [Ruminococcaceae bacterium]|nr:hypothetical protein [Oscillospiraceae bacterium]
MATLLQDMYAHQLINEVLTDLRPETTISGISGYNTSGVDISVPAGVVNAMIKIFLSEKIGIGVTETGEIYTEVMGNERDTHVGVLFNPREKKVSACQFDVNDVTTKQALVLKI